MLLSTEDIERLERKGYSKKFFVSLTAKVTLNCEIDRVTAFSTMLKSNAAKSIGRGLWVAAFTP